MRLAQLSPGGKVILALWDAPMRFGSLKAATGLSSAWLDRTLKQLHREGIIEHDVVSKTYAIKKTEQLRTRVDSLMPIYLTEIASRVAEELAKDERVLAIILFGSVAIGRVTPGSDIDLLVVLEELDRKIEGEFILKLSNLGFKFGVAIEPVLLSREDFKSTLAASVGLIFGLARGYEVLYDKELPPLTKLLDESVAKVRTEYSFEKEGEIWLPKKELTAKV